MWEGRQFAHVVKMAKRMAYTASVRQVLIRKNFEKKEKIGGQK